MIPTLRNPDIKVNYQTTLIEFDNSELIQLAKNTIAKYKDLVVTPEIVTDIKKEVANLNAMIKDVDAKRIKIKKDYTAPLTAFETKIKEVTTILSTTVVDLKKQLQIFEDQRKLKVKEFLDTIILNFNEKYKLVDKYYNQLKIHDHYYNKTAEPAEVKADIESQFVLLAQSAELEQLKLDQAAQETERLATEREQKVKARCELITTLNKQFNVEFSFDQFEDKTDAQVMSIYAEDFAKRQEQTKVQINANNWVIATKEKVKPTATYTLTISNITSGNIDSIVRSLKTKMPHATFRIGE